MPSAKYAVRESDILGTIMDWLKVHRIWHRRNNVGSFGNEHGGKKRFHSYGLGRGSPDIIVLHNNRIIGIEVKGPAGEQSQLQREFQTEWEREGGIYVIARGLEDVFRVIGAR